MVVVWAIVGGRQWQDGQVATFTCAGLGETRHSVIEAGDLERAEAGGFKVVKADVVVLDD